MAIVIAVSMSIADTGNLFLYTVFAARPLRKPAPSGATQFGIRGWTAVAFGHLINGALAVQGFLSFVGLALWIAAWVLIVRRRKKMGLLLANTAGFIVGFILFAVFVALVAPEPTAEERQAQAVARGEREKAAADAKAKKELEEAAASRLRDRSDMAAIICANFVESSLKSPKSADFPGSRAAGGSRALGDQTYQVRSYVDAQNSFGAELRNWYECKIQYRSGLDGDPSSWRLLALDFTK